MKPWRAGVRGWNLRLESPVHVKHRGGSSFAEAICWMIARVDGDDERRR